MVPSPLEFSADRIFKGPGFAETLFLGTVDGQRIIRKASNPDARDFSRLALIREIILLRNLPETLAPYFPGLIRTNLGDRDETSTDLPEIIFYDLPYYAPEDGWTTLSTLLVDGALNSDIARKVIAEIVEITFTYFCLDERIPAKNYVDTTMLSAIRGSIKWAYADPDFSELLSRREFTVNGRVMRNIPGLMDYFDDTNAMRELLTPHRDRFLHGDFFPENILYNTITGRWLLLDPVSVRGVHRGDFVLDLNKMEDWLTGELPALRLGRFTLDISGSSVDFTLHRQTGDLSNLHSSGLAEWYGELIRLPAYKSLFADEEGWEHRWRFVKAFYALCMLPLADKRQAVARYFLALQAMADFAVDVERRDLNK